MTLTASALAFAKPAPKETPMPEKDAAAVQALFKDYKKALLAFDLNRLESMTMGDTREMVRSAKTTDAESKKFLTEHFQGMGKQLEAGTFSAPTVAGDTATVAGKTGTAKARVRFILDHGNWKVVDAMVDDSEATSERLADPH